MSAPYRNFWIIVGMTAGATFWRTYLPSIKHRTVKTLLRDIKMRIRVRSRSGPRMQAQAYLVIL